MSLMICWQHELNDLLLAEGLLKDHDLVDIAVEDPVGRTGIPADIPGTAGIIFHAGLSPGIAGLRLLRGEEPAIDIEPERVPFRNACNMMPVPVPVLRNVGNRLVTLPSPGIKIDHRVAGFHLP